MEDRKPLWNRIRTAIGLLCLGSMLALLPLGVSPVRAGDGTETLMSVDPLRVVGPQSTAPVVPVAPPVEAEGRIKSGSPRVEVQPGVFVLNTRGYNYGQAPSALDPAAMKREAPPEK